MGTTINLYYTYSGDAAAKWELIPSRLLVVEDIASYLNGKAKYTITNFQYIKNELEIGINVDISQSYSQPKTSTSFKYVSIQNTDESIHYYFIKKATWRSKSCVRFELVMDVLNTFKENADYKFHDNTRIIREHKDRLVYKGNQILINISNLSTHGTIQHGDSVELLGETPLGDWEHICDCTYLLSPANRLFLNVDELISVADLQTLLNNYTGRTLTMAIDNSNYWEFTGTQLRATPRVYRVIDYIHEDINPILINKGRSLIQKSANILKQDWYLLYRNQNDPTDSLLNPVECYLIPENETKVDSGLIVSGKLTATSLMKNKYYYALIYKNGELYSQSITLPDGTIISTSQPIALEKWIEITRTSENKLNVICHMSGNVERYYLDLDYITLNSMPFKYLMYDTRQYNEPLWNNEEEWTENLTGSMLLPMSQLDKTDAKNIKLIKLPYCPFDFSISGNKIVIPAEWNYTYFTQANSNNFYALKLEDLNTKLNSTLYNEDSPLDELRFRFPDSVSIHDLRDSYTTQELESKLFHSDFYRPTFVYDSFSFYFQLEKLDMDYYEDIGAFDIDTAIRFDMTSTINSRFLFTFTNYVLDKAEQNYYNVMPVARNNEEVLYNVPYINYIRTGYNYDVKSKNISNASNAIGLGLSMASIGASLLMPSVPLKIAGIVASVVSMANAIKNTAVSAINNENAIKQKILSTQNQASSVSGSDDVDLMSVYADNRLSYILYEPTDFMKNILKDLFFYAGYNSGRIGIPNHNTRINFDYLECEASIEAISSIPEDCLTELINCMKTGITYLHKTSRRDDPWDFLQKYENWEKWIFESEE